MNCGKMILRNREYINCCKRFAAKYPRIAPKRVVDQECVTKAVAIAAILDTAFGKLAQSSMSRYASSRSIFPFAGARIFSRRSGSNRIFNPFLVIFFFFFGGFENLLFWGGPPPATSLTAKRCAVPRRPRL